MSPPLGWGELLRRLEEDARLAREEPGHSWDDDAWQQLSTRVWRHADVVAAHLGLPDADELAQETLLRFQSIETLRRVRLAGSPEGYLYVLLKNLAVDGLRRQQREARITATLFREKPAGKVEGTDPDTPVTAVALRQELRRLGDHERELLRLRFWDGLSIADIARRTGAPYSRVAVRLFRLLKRLKSSLGEGERPRDSNM